MKNIFLSVVVICTLVVAGIGGVLADWQETDQGDWCLSAGYLNLKVDVGSTHDIPIDPISGLDANNFGQFLCAQNLEPSNNGAVDLSFHVYGDATICGAELWVRGTATGDEGLYVEPEYTAGDLTSTGEGELAKYLFITIWNDTDHDAVKDEGETVLWDGTMYKLLLAINVAEPGIKFMDLLKCQDYYIGISYHMFTYAEAPTVNQCMGDSLVGNLYFTVKATHCPK